MTVGYERHSSNRQSQVQQGVNAYALSEGLRFKKVRIATDCINPLCVYIDAETDTIEPGVVKLQYDFNTKECRAVST